MRSSCRSFMLEKTEDSMLCNSALYVLAVIGAMLLYQSPVCIQQLSLVANNKCLALL